MKVSKTKYKEGGKVSPTDPHKKYSQHPADTAPNSPENKREKESQKAKTRRMTAGPVLGSMLDNTQLTQGSVNHWIGQAEQELSTRSKKLKTLEYGTAEYKKQKYHMNVLANEINRASNVAANLGAKQKEYKRGGMIKVNKKKC